MSHYLTKKISGKQPVLVDRNDECHKYMVTGSILNNDVRNASVWGCGVAWSNDRIPAKNKIYAVRGYLTGELCKAQNIPFDEVYGDPAILLPFIYPSFFRKISYDIGIIPHYVDMKIVYDKLGYSEEELNGMGIKIINPLDDVETVADDINKCRKIISSTLHGIITSHAYGIPALWVKFSDGIGGDDFKYKDYFSTTDKSNTNFVDLRTHFSLDVIKEFISQEFEKTTITVSAKELFSNCPFKP